MFAFSIDGDRPFPFDYHIVFYFLALLRLTVAYLGWNTINDAGREGRLGRGISTNLDERVDVFFGRE